IGIFAICAVLSFTIPNTPSAARRSSGESPFGRMVHDVQEGVLVIVQTPVLLKAIGYLSLATASYLMVAVLGPEFISGVLGLPQQDFAFIIAPAGLGVLVGVLAVGRIAGRLGPERTIDWGVTAAGILLVLLGLLASIDRIFRPGATSVALATIVVAGMLA